MLAPLLKSAAPVTLNCGWPSTDVAQAAARQIANWPQQTPRALLAR
jgi:hypothetical protein